MTTGTINESQRKAARVAGFFYLLTFAIVVAVNFGINERLIVAGDATQTARNVLAHERLFRIGIASNLVYEAGLLVLLSALYVTLRPAGRTLALLAGFSRLVYASMWILMSLNQLTALRLLNGADYLRVLGTEQAQRWGGCISPALTPTTSACCSMAWHPPLAATCFSSQATSHEDSPPSA